jgi:hypothetical protein
MISAGRCGLVALALSAPAHAQYGFDPAAALARQGSAIQYVGSSKDDNGSFLSGVTVEISGHESAYVFVTDDEGRFRGDLPASLAAEKMTAKCSKRGFELVRVTMRPGPKSPRPTVQVDCVLRLAKSG